MIKTIPVLAALAAASVLVVPTISRGAEADIARVSYADLNLASDVGASILSKRIDSAARAVCGIEDSREQALARATSKCRSAAIAGAQPQFVEALAAARNPSVTVVPMAISVIAR